MRCKGVVILFVIWLSAVAFYMFTRMLSTSMTSLSIPLREVFHYSQVEIAWAISAYGIAMMIMKIPVGMTIDRYGLSKPLAIAMLVTIAGTIMLAFPYNATLLMLARFVIGLGASFAMMSAYKLTSLVFPVHMFALITGVIYFMGSLAVSISGAPLTYAVLHYAYTPLILCLALGGLLIFTSYATAHIWRKNINIPDTRVKNFADYFKGVGNILCDRQLMITLCYGALLTTGFFALVGYWGGNTLQHIKPISAPQASLIGNSIMSISSGIASIAVGLLIYFQWISRRQIVVMTTLATLSIVVIFYTATINIWILSLCSILIGIGFGYTGVIFDTLNKRAKTLLVTSMTLLFLMEYIIATFLNPLVAYILSWSIAHGINEISSYHIAFTLIFSLFIIANILSFWIVPQRTVKE